MTQEYSQQILINEHTFNVLFHKNQFNVFNTILNTEILDT